ncbi:signal transduction histidine kinase [Propioniferax innocua]|uniref:histidine kinase n=2 Tax=Propioniferax innocua TaxID=1753 RepID=A0A542ZCV1_9ACTN|nr:signal transduction histidine kinase [Propioniferax innocua]
MMVLTFTAVGLGLAGALTFSILFGVLEDRVDRELYQELAELQALADQRGEDEEPFTDVTSLLRAATDAAVPSQHESVLALTNGEPRFRPKTQDFDLATPEVIEALKRHRSPGETVYIDVESPKYGQLRVLIASVEVEGDPTEGTFVVASAIETQRDLIWQSAFNYIAVSIVTLILVGTTAWIAVGRLLRPLETLQQATEEITVDDFNRRVPVPDSDDEIAALAGRFNLMLDRLQSGYDAQRQFLRDAGHELRTPITIVQGTVEMMSTEDADFDESRSIALDELDRMGRLVGDLSVLAQTRQPDFVRLAPVDMTEFAHDALARVRRVGDREWVLDRTAPVTAQVDQQRLMQAVVQLAANAVRYSEPDTSVHLAVDHRSHSGGSDVVVSMRDHGIGIAHQDHARIFERFARLDATGERPGSGLGLPIVRAIAEAHGGRIEVESSPGQGSRFSLVIPQRTEKHKPTNTDE